MTSLELLKEIEAWLCFNTEPPKEETAKLRKSINEHIKDMERKTSEFPYLYRYNFFDEAPNSGDGVYRP